MQESAAQASTQFSASTERSRDTGFATAAFKKSIDHTIRPLHTQTGAWTGDTYGWVVCISSLQFAATLAVFAVS